MWAVKNRAGSIPESKPIILKKVKIPPVSLFFIKKGENL
jgi:hypothetical protein